MDSKYCRIYLLGIIFVVALGCNLPAASTPTLDLFATLSASTPLTDSPSADSTPVLDQPSGHIVFTCQVFKVQSSNQVCIMNADGSDYRHFDGCSSRKQHAHHDPNGCSGRRSNDH